MSGFRHPSLMVQLKTGTPVQSHFHLLFRLSGIFGLSLRCWRRCSICEYVPTDDAQNSVHETETIVELVRWSIASSDPLCLCISVAPLETLLQANASRPRDQCSMFVHIDHPVTHTPVIAIIIQSFELLTLFAADSWPTFPLRRLWTCRTSQAYSSMVLLNESQASILSGKGLLMSMHDQTTRIISNLQSSICGATPTHTDSQHSSIIFLSSDIFSDGDDECSSVMLSARITRPTRVSAVCFVSVYSSSIIKKKRISSKRVH